MITYKMNGNMAVVDREEIPVHGEYDVVVVGGGEVGAETAEYLAWLNRKVTVVEMNGAIAGDMAVRPIRTNILEFLQEYHVNCLVNTRAIAIQEDGLSVERDGEKSFLPADNIVLALGYRPVNGLVAELEGVCKQLVVIGGAQRTSNALEASRDGLIAGYTV